MILSYTLYFPYLLKLLIRHVAPQIDPFNEAGEKRTEMDEEYNRLMNFDLSPYNFLYNVHLFGDITLRQGYKPRWASFKIYILVTRLLYGCR